MLASIAERERFRPKVKNIRRDIERWPGGFVFTPLALWRGVLALQASFGRAGGEALSVWPQRTKDKGGLMTQEALNEALDPKNMLKSR